ncbi:DUF3027 domain-containing protein [Corynebacterium tapiri]|uniref:DUF3027 domain-containing protein n=1 Tax=Corynebacterium tapiri TaxID=1448266 RepID=A0A5C4U700_9CORY|nr:DUF3027 domain-containing protein [Corynebacterium tapiri]TNM00388.1 DUF3027 domain-containing protein [Corynebacterium tapiri]
MGSVSQPRQARSSRPHRRSPLLTPQAIEIAREALIDCGETGVGEHVGVTGINKHVAIHRFAAEVPGYPGWEWNVVVACAEGSDEVTINELALVPAPSGHALAVPEWVPYSQRVRPGDLGPGDLMPAPADDPRLVESADSPQAASVEGPERRTRHLSLKGLQDAKHRWRVGNYGPTSEFAEKAALNCASCAFFIPAAEPIGRHFGVCVNEFSADGILVNATYGCGAHSETKLKTHDQPGEVFDDEKPIF